MIICPYCFGEYSTSWQEHMVEQTAHLKPGGETEKEEMCGVLTILFKATLPII
jgi:hypothetical protein